MKTLPPNKGCGKSRHPTCSACIKAQAFKEVLSCGLNMDAEGKPIKGFEDSKPQKHCGSKCPFPEGCFVCTL